MTCQVWLVLVHVIRFENSLEGRLHSTSKKEIRTKEDTHTDKYHCPHKSQGHISIFLTSVSLTIKKLNYAVYLAENELLGRMGAWEWCILEHKECATNVLLHQNLSRPWATTDISTNPISCRKWCTQLLSTKDGWHDEENPSFFLLRLNTA